MLRGVINDASEQPRPVKPCIIVVAGELCGKRVAARDMCSKHYTRWQRHGDPLTETRSSPMPPGAIEKYCPRCQTVKSLGMFNLRPNGRPKGWCAPCEQAYQAERVATGVGKEQRQQASAKWVAGPRKEYNLQWRYGLTLAEYEALVAAQGSRCAICGADKPGGNARTWPVDHCHDSNAVRGLLCVHCNMGIGQFQDDPERLRAAADYIERHRITA